MDREEVAAWAKERAAVATPAKVYQLRQTDRVGKAMAELITDPRWATYVQHLELMRNAEATAAKAVEAVLTGSKMLESQEYAQAKINLAAARASADAYGKAVEMVQVLVTRGEEAMGELAKLPEEKAEAI